MAPNVAAAAPLPYRVLADGEQSAKVVDVEITQSGIEFGLRYADGRYIVSMRPNVTPDAPNQSLSAQVTLKVPHAEGADRFIVRNPQPAVNGTYWVPLSRVDAPEENRHFDYISFEVSYTLGDRTVFGWTGGKEIDVFSFENSGPCLGAVYLMSNGDLFMPPPGGANSAGTNPGNYIAVRGLNANDDNDYIGNLLHDSARCLPRTDVRIKQYAVWATDAGVLITWETNTESDVLGFNVQQLEGDGATQLNAELLTAERSGQSSGAAYQYLQPDPAADALTDTAAHVEYQLQIVTLNGEAINVLLGPAMRSRLHLPLILQNIMIISAAGWRLLHNHEHYVECITTVTER
ncbi:MAG: hypothetical protein R2911_43940 [Caldilineaceae bacterium]